MPSRFFCFAIALFACLACGATEPSTPNAGFDPDASTDGETIDAPSVVDAGTVAFVSTGSLHVARNGHTATLRAARGSSPPGSRP